MIKPNTTYVIPFETTAAGIATAADSTPTAVLWRNGSAEPTAVVIITTANTGIYHATFTTDDEWLPTDRLWLIVSATISGDAYTGIAWDSFSESDSKASIAEAVAQYDQRDEDSTPGTSGWYFKKLRQASNTVEAVVTNDITPTATTFSVALTTYPTGAFKHSVLAVVEDGAILDQNSPILTFTNNTTYSTIVLEEAFTQAPAVGNVLLINVVSHVHSVASIAAGVWGATSSAYSAATGTFGYVLNALSTMIEYVSGVFRWKSSSATVITDEIASVESKVDDVLTGVNSLNNNDRGAFF